MDECTAHGKLQDHAVVTRVNRYVFFFWWFIKMIYTTLKCILQTSKSKKPLFLKTCYTSICPSSIRRIGKTPSTAWLHQIRCFHLPGTQKNDGAVLTSGGNLSCKHIAHMVGPSTAAGITSSIEKVLDLCEGKTASSLSVPAIGTGENTVLWENGCGMLHVFVGLNAVG